MPTSFTEKLYEKNVSSPISFDHSSLYTKVRNRMKTVNDNSKIVPLGSENLHLEARLSCSCIPFPVMFSLPLQFVFILLFFSSSSPPIVVNGVLLDFS